MAEGGGFNGGCAFPAKLLPSGQSGGRRIRRRPGPASLSSTWRVRQASHFVHCNAASSEKYLIETMGSGCGWIDFDQDGLLDLYLVNGAATRLYTPRQPLRSALYRNNGDGTFTDVTAKAGVGAEGLFGMGVAVGDYDNDGFPDLYVLGWDRCILYHNNGDGTFTDVTAKARRGERRQMGIERRLVRLRQRRASRPGHRELCRLVAGQQRLVRRA